jgi:hypothetical protein
MDNIELFNKLKKDLNLTEPFKGKDNFFIAKYLFENFKGELISTTFNENPYYGDKDLALKYKGNSFSRITSTNVCNNESIDNLLNQYKNNKKFNLKVISNIEDFTRIDGMFLKFSDNSYLSFISLHHPKGNKGLIIIDKTAESYFKYYKDLKTQF